MIISLLFLTNQINPPFVSPMFSDNMVLQRDMKDPVFGWTTPGATVTVTINNKISRATADQNGTWRTTIGPFRAGGPYTLSVKGEKEATFGNVMFGDVWLCSGQSNMEMGVGIAANADQEIAGANYPNMRLYAIPHWVSPSPIAFTVGSWKPCSPETIKSEGDWGGFSATAYYFGRQLHQDLNVPIGLIHSSWGGTVAEAWTREDFLNNQMPEFRPLLTRLAGYRNRPPIDRAQELAGWYAKNDAGTSQSWFDPSVSNSDWQTMSVPGFFQDAGIPELKNAASVVWFRKQIEVPQEIAGKPLILHFVVDDNDA